MRSPLILPILAALLGLCAACGEGPPPLPPESPSPPVAPGAPIMPAAPIAPGAQAIPAAGGSNFGTIAVAAGFTPDPQISRGTSGGQTNASTLNPACSGWISSTPDHLISATTPLSNLRLLVNGGGADTTLVVQLANGSYLCDDDSEGLHPIVQGAFPAGVHRIWIGSYEQGQSARYTLGISELGGVTAASLPAPAGA